jgi:hypothetical protein
MVLVGPVGGGHQRAGVDDQHLAVAAEAFGQRVVRVGSVAA